jgi:Styrene monooxygenase A putative substrate binding domain
MFPLCMPRAAKNMTSRSWIWNLGLCKYENLAKQEDGDMRKITIVGAGQSGLMVGVGLVRKGYEVSIVSNQTPEEIRNGRVTSSQAMNFTAVLHEREFGLRLWEDIYHPYEGVQFNVLNPENAERTVSFSRLMGPQNGVGGQFMESIDQRVKMPAWIYRFEELGGKMIYEDADIASLERYAAESDLVLVASGKGEIGKLCSRDDEKSLFDKPQRALGLAYVKNMAPVKSRQHGDFNRGFAWNAHPGVGEYFSLNALTTNGECDVMVFEGIPGGPMDILDTRDGTEAYMKNAQKILADFFPDEALRCQNIELTDELGILSGRFPPTIRKPVLHLPNGGVALGIADTVALNDPITGQGSNNASKAAKVVFDAIIAHGYRDFDENWMQGAFDTFWDKAKYCVDWTNAILQAPSEAQMKVLMAANESQEMADWVFRGFDDPELFFPEFMDEAAAQRMITQLTSAGSAKAA